MEAIAKQISAWAPERIVLCAYLEISKPDLSTAFHALKLASVQSVTVVPMFLGVGKHAREDLPILVEDLRRHYADMQIVLAPPVSEDPRLIEMLATIAMTTY